MLLPATILPKTLIVGTHALIRKSVHNCYDLPLLDPGFRRGDKQEVTSYRPRIKYGVNSSRYPGFEGCPDKYGLSKDIVKTVISSLLYQKYSISPPPQYSVHPLSFLEHFYILERNPKLCFYLFPKSKRNHISPHRSHCWSAR